MSDYDAGYEDGAKEAVSYEILRLREENARLRKALKPFARMEDRCLGRHDVDYEYVLISHIRAAAAAIREGERDA